MVVWHPPLESGGGAIHHYELQVLDGLTKSVNNTFYVTTQEEQDSNIALRVRKMEFSQLHMV